MLEQELSKQLEAWISSTLFIGVAVLGIWGLYRWWRGTKQSTPQSEWTAQQEQEAQRNTPGFGSLFDGVADHLSVSTAASSDHEDQTPPTLVYDDINYTTRSMKYLGGGAWYVQFGPRGQTGGSGTFTISRGTQSLGIGPTTVRVFR
jgi:hypothetical protein